jgi:hypothetical protein
LSAPQLGHAWRPGWVAVLAGDPTVVGDIAASIGSPQTSQ